MPPICWETFKYSSRFNMFLREPTRSLFRRVRILGSYIDFDVLNEYVFLLHGSVFERKASNLILQLDLICCTTGTEAWIQKLK
jgi:hypothetical protein